MVVSGPESEAAAIMPELTPDWLNPVRSKPMIPTDVPSPIVTRVCGGP